MTTVVAGQLVTAAQINQWSPPGAVIDYAGAAAPSGWLLCDGASYLRSDYPALFTAIGTTFGAADGTHFNVPDCRGRVPVGYAASGGHTDVATLGNNDGVATANRRPKHNSTNSLTLPDHTHTDSGASGAAGVTTHAQSSAAGGGTTVITGGVSSTPAINGTIGPGGTAPVDTPAYIVLNKIIRAKDV